MNFFKIGRVWNTAACLGIHIHHVPKLVSSDQVLDEVEYLYEPLDVRNMKVDYVLQVGSLNTDCKRICRMESEGNKSPSLNNKNYV